MSSVERRRNTPRIYVIELKQDDPSNNTSAKMRRFGYATIVSPARIPRESIVLDPFSELTLLPKDGEAALRLGLVVIDCCAFMKDYISTSAQAQEIRDRNPLQGIRKEAKQSTSARSTRSLPATRHLNTLPADPS